MGLQDIDPKIQNSTALQFSYVDSTNSVPGQNFEQHGDRKGHATSGHQVGSNPVIAAMILPQRTSVPGTLFLVLSWDLCFCFHRVFSLYYVLNSLLAFFSQNILLL